MNRRIPAACLFAAAIGAVFLLVAAAAEGKAGAAAKPLTPVFSEAVAYDVSPPLYSLAQQATLSESAVCALGGADRNPSRARTGR